MSDPVRTFVTEILEKVQAGTMHVREAAEKLLGEMGRGGRNLVVDESCYGVEPHLSAKGYTVYRVKTGTPDELIMPQLESRVFVTRNGRDFAEPKDMEKHYYGLVWLIGAHDDKETADRIAEALMRANFGAKLVQVVRVE